MKQKIIAAVVAVVAIPLIGIRFVGPKPDTPAWAVQTAERFLSVEEGRRIRLDAPRTTVLQPRQWEVRGIDRGTQYIAVIYRRDDGRVEPLLWARNGEYRDFSKAEMK